jgi:hypothetical protein
MNDSTTRTVIWPRFAAQDRHVPKVAVPLAPPPSARNAASAIHDHLTALAWNRSSR